MSDKSYYPKQGDVKEQWYLIDAEGEVVGRLASRIALILRGKNEPTYTPGVNSQNFVVVINADKAVLTGNKELKKRYYRHTQYPGGLKETFPRELEARKPGEVLRFAVHGMLPKTPLGEQLKRHLRLFAGPNHDHEAQQPVKLENLTKKREVA